MTNVYCTPNNAPENMKILKRKQVIWLTSLQRPVQSQSCKCKTSQICSKLTASSKKYPADEHIFLPSQQ